MIAIHGCGIYKYYARYIDCQRKSAFVQCSIIMFTRTLKKMKDLADLIGSVRAFYVLVKRLNDSSCR